MKFLITLIILLIVNISLVTASVGIGISPSKLVDSINSMKSKEYDYIIYNTGDINITAKMYTEGELSDYITITPSELFLLPEPEPHRLPPVNGKMIKVKVRAPFAFDEKNYTSKIIASVSPGFGGVITTGAVASNIEITVKKDFSIIFYIFIIILFIIIFYFTKKRKR